MSSSAEEEAGKYRVENQQMVQGQVIGDHATVHIYPAAPSASVAPSPAKWVWNVPYPRNVLFTGRSELLDQLASTLRTGQPAALSQPPKDVQPQAISGLGGIGKTQVALEYAYRYRGEYQAVLWAVAENRETLTSSYLEVARLLNLAEKDAQESGQVIVAVKEWLRTSRNYLLILDNADDLKLAQEFVPPTFGGHILLTTRAQAMGRFAKRLEVEVLPLSQGVAFLLRRAGLLAEDAAIEDASEEDRQVAREICVASGCLPLALDQAGAYLEETQSSLVEYQQLYQHQRVALLKERGGLISDHPEAVATTWAISFQQVEEQNPVAADLLRVCAFLAPDAIAETIITQGREQLGPHIQELATDPLALKKAIAVLGAYSLVKRDAEKQTVSVHRLVQVVLRDQMDQASQRQWAERTVRAMDAAFPEVAHENWPECEQLVPHALVSAGWIEQEQMKMTEALHLLKQAGWYLMERARYSEAEKLLQLALVCCQQQKEALPLSLATGLNDLAELYWRQGKYGEAEPLVEHALLLRRQELGEQHPDVAQSLNDLGVLYAEQGKYGEAEPLYQRALAIREQTLGAVHPDTATSLNNLALLYETQGKYGEAEPLMERALAIAEEQLGPNHPQTAGSLNNLALLYQDQGKYSEAEPLMKRALAISEQALGAMHPDVAGSLNNLALLYQDQGKYEEAEPLYQRALAIKEQVLGAMHPSTATSLNNLAGLYRAQGKYSEAEPLYQRALAIQEQTLGAMHPSTATSLNDLAGLYEAQGKHPKAEPLRRQALAIYEKQLGAMHPWTVTALNNLASLYQAQGKYKEAEPLYERALAIKEQALGLEHPSTRLRRRNYAALLRAVGREQEAEELEARNQQQS